MVSEGLRQAADAVVQDVENAYAAAEKQLARSPDTVWDWFGLSTVIPTVSHNLADMRSMISEWESTYRSWAENGQRDDGTPYTWELWASFGKDLESDAALQGNVVVDSSKYTAVVQAAQATQNQIETGAGQVWEGTKKVFEVAANVAKDPLGSLTPILYIAGGVLVLYGLVVLWPARKAVARAVGGTRRLKARRSRR